MACPIESLPELNEVAHAKHFKGGLAHRKPRVTVRVLLLLLFLIVIVSFNPPDSPAR